MNILYVVEGDFTSQTYGCNQRSVFLYKALCNIGKVTILDPASLGQRQFIHRSLSVLFRKLTKVARWPFGRSVKKISTVLAANHKPQTPKSYDAVVCRYLDSAAEVNAWKLGRCYVDVDDLPIEAFDSVECGRLPFWLRPFSRWFTLLWQYYCFSKCSGVWAISETQLEVLLGLSLNRVALLPNLARGPGPAYKVNEHQKMMLMTVGLMGYLPNHEGVGWFLDNIWPAVNKRWPHITYAIAGGELPDAVRSKWLTIPGVKLLGFVEDLDALYEKALAVVAPILSGSGTCIKVVEAGLHGRKVLATKVANRGVNLPKTVTTFDTAEEFVKELDQWMSNSDLVKAQKEIAAEAKEWNSVERFEQSVKKVLLGGW